MKGIAFFGEQGSGKTTAAKYLVEKYGAVKVSFADALREEAADIVCYVLDEEGNDKLYDKILLEMQTPGEKEKYRDLLRWLGPFRRRMDPDYWVRRWHVRILASPRGVLIVTDDLRYDNERERIESSGFGIVRIEREGVDRSHDTHESESDWRGWKSYYTLYNDFDSVQDFTDMVGRCVARWIET